MDANNNNLFNLETFKTLMVSSVGITQLALEWQPLLQFLIGIATFIYIVKKTFFEKK